MTRFALVSALGPPRSLSQGGTAPAEEFQINRLRRYLALLGVFTFFFSLFVMDPPTPSLRGGGWRADWSPHYGAAYS